MRYVLYTYIVLYVVFTVAYWMRYIAYMKLLRLKGRKVARYHQALYETREFIPKWLYQLAFVVFPIIPSVFGVILLFTNYKGGWEMILFAILGLVLSLLFTARVDSKLKGLGANHRTPTFFTPKIISLFAFEDMLFVVLVISIAFNMA